MRARSYGLYALQCSDLSVAQKKRLLRLHTENGEQARVSPPTASFKQQTYVRIIHAGIRRFNWLFRLNEIEVPPEAKKPVVSSEDSRVPTMVFQTFFPNQRERARERMGGNI